MRARVLKLVHFIISVTRLVNCQVNNGKFYHIFQFSSRIGVQAQKFRWGGHESARLASKAQFPFGGSGGMLPHEILKNTDRLFNAISCVFSGFYA